MDLLLGIGQSVKDTVLNIAGLLKVDAAPGFVVLLLLIALIVVTLRFWLQIRERLRAVGALKKLIDGGSGAPDFGQSVDFIEGNLRKEGTSKAFRQVATTWKEYRETFVPHVEDGRTIIRNSVRPSTFFNPEDLGFSAGSWRIVPGLFVTIGLFLTFLGLISALGSMDLSTDKVESSLKTLLTIASAKFIMSLTGLLCSIIFTIVLRRGMARVEGALHQLCEDIENRLTFISLEELAIEQLAATREQREHFRAIGMELVAELGRPLREELPAAISASITTAMTPLLDQVRQVGTDGMGSMVNELSSRLSSDVGRALSQASERLSEAGDRLAAISDSLANGSGRMGAQMEAAVGRLADAVSDLRSSVGETAKTATGALTEGTDRLLSMMNQTLEQIRDHNRDGAAAMSAAASEIREAAAGFRSELASATADGANAAKSQLMAASGEAQKAISGAGENVIAAFGRTASQITDATEALSSRTTERLFEPMDQIASRISSMVQEITASSEHLGKLRDGIRGSAEAAERASGSIRTASQDFTAAAEPLRLTAEQMATDIQTLANSTRKVGDVVMASAQSTAQSAASVLKAAQETLGGESKAVQASLKAVEQMLDKLKGQGERLDDIDEKLGKAFEEYRTRVEAAVGTLFGHVRDMQKELAPAIDTLKSVVDQAQDFMPESKRR